MKTLYLLSSLLIAYPIFAEKNSWTPVPVEVQEKIQIMKHIAQINEYFVGMGARRSSAREGAIFSYLQSLGTPTAFKVLKELVQSGDLPKHFLNMA